MKPPAPGGGPGILAVSAFKPSEFPLDGLPQIALAGRSNVGKSSLVNLLTGRKKLAQVSQTPGKTRRIHFYLLPGPRYLVDWPGFGYAAVSQTQRREMEAAIRYHAENTPALRGVVYLLDMRLEGTRTDAEALSWLLGTGLPVLLVGTKADQVSKNRRPAVLRALAERYGTGLPPLALSSRTGEGRDALWEQMTLLWDTPEEAVAGEEAGGAPPLSDR